KLRWGLAAKHFDTLAVASPKETGFIGLSVTNFDLKYRFSPGIWGRDPSVGILLSGQNVKFNFKRSGQDFEATAPMVGGGMFWARSMPKIIDDFFNLVPFMRYPKWVDAEAIFYPLIL